MLLRTIFLMFLILLCNTWHSDAMPNGRSQEYYYQSATDFLMGAMELSKVTSKTSSIKALLLKAWRERWSDLQWGIHIKTILPRGVSGDVYNLADVILQQALVGPGPNDLVLSYLRHSLSCQLVSYAALLQNVSKYLQFQKPHCLLSLLDLLETNQAGSTCRGRTEEGILAASLMSVILWLLQCYHYYFSNGVGRTPLYDEIEIKCVSILTNMLASNFTTTMLYLARHEDKDLYTEILKKCTEIEHSHNSTVVEKDKMNDMEACLKKLQIIKLKTNIQCESVTYCLQPLLSVEVTINPCAETAYLVNKLIMLQRLKGYSNSRLYCEIMRACLISLNNVLGTSEESQWGAFTFLKLPHIFKQLHLNFKDDSSVNSEFSMDIVDAFDLLLQLRPLLDIVDSKCNCDFVECLLHEFTKFHLMSPKHVARINEKRALMANSLLKSQDSTLQQQSIPKVIVRAEPTLPRLLRTLDTDNIKMENLLSVLGQVLTGKSFELILAVATVEGKLRSFVHKLIKFNETYKHGGQSESAKQAQNRALLFDVSFLMLCSIVNQYGSQFVLSEEGGDSFFEMWVRECMVEKGHPKPPESIINLCDSSKVDPLLAQFNSNEEFKFTQVKWDQSCLSAPGAIKEVLLAWEQGALTANDVKRILDAMRANVCCLPVCATAWLCSYMQILQQDALLKPMNMVQQLAITPVEEHNDNFKTERFAFMLQIIRRMQHNIHPAASSKLSLQYGIISNTPISTQLEIVWNKIHKQGWVNIEATHQLQSLFATGGPCWFITNVLKEVFKYSYQEELNRAVDLAFAIFHLDIENCTLSLLLEVLPQYLHNKLQCEDLVEPQLTALAKLCVYCIFSAAQNPPKDASGRKRSRKVMEGEDADVLYPASKLLKISSGEAAVGFGSSAPNCKAPVMSPTLQAACNQLFNAFLVISNREGEISEQTHFVYKFLETMVQCGGEKTRLVLQGQPLDSLMPNLIRWLPDMLTVELIAGLYDVSSASGRRAAARDLCMLTNLQASPFYK